jgi:hypothetical protein
VNGTSATLLSVVNCSRIFDVERVRPLQTPGRSGLKNLQALHRHHQRLGLESIIASLFSNASSDAGRVDSTTSTTSGETPVDLSTSLAADGPATEDTTAASSASP